MNLATPQVLAFALGMPEILLIVFALVLLFGAKRLPELAKGVGKSMKEFKKAANSDDDEDDEKPAPASKNGTTKVTKES